MTWWQQRSLQTTWVHGGAGVKHTSPMLKAYVSSFPYFFVFVFNKKEIVANNVFSSHKNVFFSTLWFIPQGTWYWVQLNPLLLQPVARVGFVHFHFHICYSLSNFFYTLFHQLFFCHFLPFFHFSQKARFKTEKNPSRSNQQLATIENGDQPGGHPGIEVFLQNVYLRNFRHKYLLEIPTNKKCCHKQGTRGNGNFDPLATLRGDSSTLLRAGVSESSTSKSTRANLTHFSSAGELRHQHFSSQNINMAAISD